MKLATLNNETRDGALCVVSRDLRIATVAYDVAPTMQSALDDWNYAAPLLGELYEEANRHPGGSRWFDLDIAQLAAPLPRAYQHIGAFAYTAHLERLCPDTLGTEWRKEVLLLQRKSIDLLGPGEEIPLPADDVDVDFGVEVAIVTDDVPAHIKREKAAEHIQLFLLGNTITLRKILSEDLARGHGSFHSHAHHSFGGIALTPDELGSAWDGRKLNVKLRVRLNDSDFGSLHTAEDMHFDFPALIVQAARNRALSAGTILSSGPVSSRNAKDGVGSIAEGRALEGKDATTPYLRFGDRVHVEASHGQDKNLFGPISQSLVQQTTRRRMQIVEEEPTPDEAPVAE
jgi:fumarylacetoacetate (FAA) hydrolase